MNHQFGPVAVDAIFPFNQEPIITHNLVLKNHKGWVGLQEFRANEEHQRPVHWRGLVHINLSNQASFVPSLSQQGTNIIKALATSKGITLDSTFTIIIQGLTNRYHWDDTSTPPSITVYSLQETGSPYTIRAHSLHAHTLQASLIERDLLSSSLIAWLRKHKENNGSTDLDAIVERYMQEYPRERAYNGPDTHNARTYRSSIRSALVPPLSIPASRKILKREGLIDRQDIKDTCHDIMGLKQRGEAREPAQPKFTITTPHHPDTGANATNGEIPTDPIDDLLQHASLFLFDVPDLPSAGSTWTCAYEECHYQFRTSSASTLHPGTATYDRKLLRFRQTVSRHLLEHLSRDPIMKKHLISNVLEI